MYSKKINVLDTCKICLFRANRKLLKEGTWQKINGPSMALHGPVAPVLRQALRGCSSRSATTSEIDLESTNGWPVEMSSKPWGPWSSARMRTHDFAGGWCPQPGAPVMSRWDISAMICHGIGGWSYHQPLIRDIGVYKVCNAEFTD